MLLGDVCPQIVLNSNRLIEDLKFLSQLKVA